MSEQLAPSAPCGWCGGSGKRLVEHVGRHERHGMPCACKAEGLTVPFLYQLEDSGCAIAAIAMATRREYAEVRRLLVMSEDLTGHGTSGGVNVGQVDDMLDELGFAWRARYENNHRLSIVRDPWPCPPFAETHVCHVRNLSDSGHHFVTLLADGRVLDPWWGVIGGLHRYPRVHSIKGLYDACGSSGQRRM